MQADGAVRSRTRHADDNRMAVFRFAHGTAAACSFTEEPKVYPPSEPAPGAGAESRQAGAGLPAFPPAGEAAAAGPGRRQGREGAEAPA